MHLLLQANALRIPLADESVQCVVTSPPYWGLRDYGVTGQLGLEPTPEEFIANMVLVFREVRRVLRDDGVCFMNLGDTYAGNLGGNRNGHNNTTWANAEIEKERSNQIGTIALRPDPRAYGMKPKDLVGIPWRSALALQEPYYTGRIRNVADRIWLAAMLDAEGCMFIHKRKAGQNNGQGYQRVNDSYGPGLEIANTHESVVNRCMAIVRARLDLFSEPRG